MKGRAAFRSTPSTSRPAASAPRRPGHSGGYELALAPGQYRIIASLNDTVIQTTNVTVNNLNIEQDFVLTNTWQGGTREAAIAAAQPQVAPPVTIPMHADDQLPINVVGTLANVTTDLSAVELSREQCQHYQPKLVPLSVRE